MAGASGHFINGAWQAPAAGIYFDTAVLPRKKLATVAQGSTLDVDSAVRAARAALPAWQSLTPHCACALSLCTARQVQKNIRRWLPFSKHWTNGKPDS